MNNEQKINTFFAQFDAQFNAMVPQIIAETATEYFKERFKAKNWDGVPWPIYNVKGAKNRKEPSRGSLMLRSLNLFSSIVPSMVTANRVVISAGGSRAPYARVHNEGLRVRGIRNVRPFTNTNFMGKGRRVQIKGHTRKVDFTMPRRQYMGHSPYLNNEIRERLIAAWNARKQ